MPSSKVGNNNNNNNDSYDKGIFQKKTPAKTFWAVRKCEALKSPAIFTDWSDCSFYVEQSLNNNTGENDNNDNGDLPSVYCPPEYEEFTIGLHALGYIMAYMVAEQKKGNKSNSDNDHTSTHQAENKKTTTTTTLRPYSQIMTQQRQQQQQQENDDSTTPTKKEQMRYVQNDTLFYKRLDKKRDYNEYIEKQEAITTVAGENDNNNNDNGKDGDDDNNNDNKRPRIEEPPPTPPPQSPSETSQTEHRSMREMADDAATDAVEEQKQRGPTLDSDRCPTLSMIWEEYFTMLERFKELNGTCEVKKGLNGWSPRLRLWAEFQWRQLCIFEANPDCCTYLDQGRADRLKALGMSTAMDITPTEYTYITTEEDGELDTGTKIVYTKPIPFISPTRALIPKANVNFDEMNIKWGLMFQQFKNYVELYKTCTVYKSRWGGSEELKEWAQNQAKQLYLYELYPDLCPCLNKHRVAQLRDLGMVPRVRKKFETYRKGPWTHMCNVLEVFVECHNHVVAPVGSQLRKWLVKQQDDWEKMQEGEPTEMNEARATKLANVGVDITRIKTFDDRLAEWQEYKKIHGKEPTTKGGKNALGRWVSEIRKKYNFKRRGGESTLTDEQIGRLEVLGFTWWAGIRLSEVKTWDERFQELEQYKKKNGHVKVPQKHPELGAWVKAQRKEYSYLERGMKSQMNPERLEKLKSLGFLFITRKSRLAAELRKEEMKYDSNKGDEAEDSVSKASE